MTPSRKLVKYVSRGGLELANVVWLLILVTNMQQALLSRALLECRPVYQGSKNAGGILCASTHILSECDVACESST